MSARALRLPALLACALALGAGAVTPLHHVHDLVAGKGDRGFRDGAFNEALFDTPAGLAADLEGHLYVADSGNNRIRVVDLEHANDVRTLCGTGTAGALDGKLDRATFDRPTALAPLPGRRLAVVDGRGSRLRIVDVAKKTVATVNAGGDGPARLEGIWSLLYVPGEDALYVTEPGRGAVVVVALADGAATTLFEKRGEVPMPGALALLRNEVYVADRGNGGIYRVCRRDDGVQLEGIERPEGIVAMGATAGRLHAVMSGRNAWARIAPYQPVSFVTPWGGLIDVESAKAHPEMLPLFELRSDRPPGFAADPREEGRFFLAPPDAHRILSLRDHGYREYGGANSYGPKGLGDYDVPLAKPPGTVRILIVGASQTRDEAAGFTPARSFTRMNTFPKQLELFLTTAASLDGLPARYEVLNLNRSVTEELTAWPVREVPAVVRAYDIDHVFLLIPVPIGIRTYFNHPLTPEGIPSPDTDAELLVVPDEEKLATPALKRLYESCKAKGLVRTNGLHLEFGPLDAMMREAQIRQDYAELMGAPFAALARTLAATPRASPGSADFTLLFVPFSERTPAEPFQTLFHDIASRFRLRLLDLTPQMVALRTTYYGFSELNGNYHLTEGGHHLLAHLLAHEIGPLVGLRRR